MIPGEYQLQDGEIELNAGLESITLTVGNTGDRPIQVGSHYHFAETNPALEFDRGTRTPTPTCAMTWRCSPPGSPPSGSTACATPSKAPMTCPPTCSPACSAPN